MNRPPLRYLRAVRLEHHKPEPVTWWQYLIIAVVALTIVAVFILLF